MAYRCCSKSSTDRIGCPIGALVVGYGIPDVVFVLIIEFIRQITLVIGRGIPNDGDAVAGR